MVAPVWRALPNTIAIEVARERECADVKCVCWKEKKSLLALKQICILSDNILSMSEENFSLQMGCFCFMC